MVGTVTRSEALRGALNSLAGHDEAEAGAGEGTAKLGAESQVNE